MPTSDSPTLSLHQRLSLSHPVVAGRYDTLHPDLDPFWQWVAMKQARENPRGDFIRDTRVLIHVGKNHGITRVVRLRRSAPRVPQTLPAVGTKVSPRQHAHRSGNAMSRSGNYYARNRRDTKPNQPTSAQTTDKTQTRTAPAASGPVRRLGQPPAGQRQRHHDRADHIPSCLGRPRGRAQEPVKPNLQPRRLEHGHLGHPIRPRHATMTTRAATMASAISNRMRQIRDRSHPATRARSATRVTSRDLRHRHCHLSEHPSFHGHIPRRVVARRRTWRARRPPRPRQDRRSGARTPVTGPLADPALRLRPLRRHSRNLRHGHVWLHPRLRPYRPTPLAHSAPSACHQRSP